MEKFKLALQKFGEAWTACSIMMVQGDFTVFTIKHGLTAAKTGSIAAILLVFTSYFVALQNRFVMAWMTGVMVSLADIVIHQTHFGMHWHEAVLTGLGAAMLSGFLYRK